VAEEGGRGEAKWQRREAVERLLAEEGRRGEAKLQRRERE
jgi:hypothetical protein